MTYLHLEFNDLYGLGGFWHLIVHMAEKLIFLLIINFQSIEILLVTCAMATKRITLNLKF